MAAAKTRLNDEVKAAILNPYKTILLPDKNAGYGLADMATAEIIDRPYCTAS
ncbi:MAG: hypothetical protein JXN64_01775 [Spirochaetes bacterium]|nr:hypothetical protein [Spirochaetota bacterium]